MTAEGLSTLILVLGLGLGMQELAFNLALLAVMVPILVTLYDAVAVPIIAWVAAGCDLKSLSTTIVALMTAVPGCVMSATRALHCHLLSA